MKRKSVFCFLLLITATMSLSSCFNSDDNDTSIDDATYKQYVKNMSGTYVGKTIFYKASSSSSSSYVKYDSTKVSTWKLAGDSIVINNFDVSKLAANITSTATEATEIKAALDTVTTKTVKAYYAIPSTSYVNTSYINCVVNPLTIEIPLTYGGASHTIKIAFYQNYYGGAYNRTAYTFSFSMVAGGIFIDSSTSDSGYLSSVFINCIASMKY